MKSRPPLEFPTIKPYILLSICLLGLNLQSGAQSVNNKSPEKIWYDQPAKAWLEALPLGNGSLGAMVFGGAGEDRIQFNESSLITGTPDTIGSYQPFGNIYIKWDHRKVKDYKRTLLLNNAVQQVNYTSGAVRYKREYFVSYPHQALVMKVVGSRPGSVTAEIRLENTHGGPIQVDGDQLSFTGQFTENHLLYEAQVKIRLEGGQLIKTDSSLKVTRANAIVLYLVAGTNLLPFSGKQFLGVPPHDRLAARLRSVAATPYAELRAAHTADFSSLFNRVHLQLGPAPGQSTVQRLKRYTTGSNDPALEALLFQYGRYLLISSSRKGGLPANLQGIWNNDRQPAWYAQYTTNINVQMNYWPAGPTNLSECQYPLLDWIENLAKINRASKDIALHTNSGWMAYSTNNAAGGPSRWRLHRPGSAWMVQHHWEQFRYTNDTSFLRTRAYPMLKEMVEYWESYLVPNKDGRLISPDGWSPEHGPGKDESDKRPYPGASYDQQIIYDLFSNYIDAAQTLKIDAAPMQRAIETRNRMLGPQIGRWGQLQEWMEDVDDSTDHHRHISHLFAVYPGRQISPITTPALAIAASRSLDARGNQSTGWSTAWKINIRARLQQGNKAHDLIRKLIRYAAPVSSGGEKSGLYPNLFDAHPPFQIDGNFGYTAGVAEMLLQSHDGAIHLLPALPDAWPQGLVQGLKARGNVTVEMRWQDGLLKRATLVAATSGIYKIRYKDIARNLHLTAGKPYTFTYQ